MAKDNFWKSAAARRALLGLSNRWEDTNAEDDFLMGQMLSSEHARKMLKAAGVKYPSQLNRDILEEANKGWWEKAFEYFTPAGWASVPLRKSYRELSNIYGTDDSFKYRLIGMTQRYPELNELIFNEDGSINEANLNRITRIAKAKLGSGSFWDPFTDNPDDYFINPKMSEDEAGLHAEKAEDYLGDALNGNINRSGELLVTNDRIKREMANQQRLPSILEAARKGSLANNDVEATIGGDPVSVLPSYVQKSYEKTSEDEMEEELFKRRTEDDEKWKQIRARARKRYDENKKDKEWWWL